MRRLRVGKTAAERSISDLMSVAIPLYVYPSPDAWAPMFIALERNPAVRFQFIVNPANGPGGPIPDTEYITNVARLNAFPNSTTYGYVHVSWAQRKAEDVFADISLWSEWAKFSKADIHVDGIFVDEAPSNLDKISYMAAIKAHSRATFNSNALIWTNPGVAVDRAFYEHADLVNAFEHSFDHWFRHKCKRNLPRDLRARASVMLHSFQHSDKKLKSALCSLLKAGHSTILVTESSTYTKLPERLLRMLCETAANGTR